jgi:two-component system cell cycle sensor histidine kinase/response regulator CckA
LPHIDSRANRPRTILVVDDEDIVRSLVARTLTEAGYRVLEASHGAAAIGQLELGANAVDLVICDLVMPVLGGKELAEWMREHRSAVPLLFVSGYPRAYLEAHGLFDPAVPMLRKPFLPSRLLEAVEEQVAAHPPVERRRIAGSGHDSKDLNRRPL